MNFKDCTIKYGFEIFFQLIFTIFTIHILQDFFFFKNHNYLFYCYSFFYDNKDFIMVFLFGSMFYINEHNKNIKNVYLSIFNILLIIIHIFVLMFFLFNKQIKTMENYHSEDNIKNTYKIIENNFTTKQHYLIKELCLEELSNIISTINNTNYQKINKNFNISYLKSFISIEYSNKSHILSYDKNELYLVKFDKKNNLYLKTNLNLNNEEIMLIGDYYKLIIKNYYTEIYLEEIKLITYYYYFIILTLLYVFLFYVIYGLKNKNM